MLALSFKMFFKDVLFQMFTIYDIPIINIHVEFKMKSLLFNKSKIFLAGVYSNFVELFPGKPKSTAAICCTFNNNYSSFSCCLQIADDCKTCRMLNDTFSPQCMLIKNKQSKTN